MMAQQLFDKIINIQFIKKDGSSDFITTPERGMKPEISLKGQFTTSSLATMIELRITNFYPSTPLSDYKKINITAGYFSSLQAVISGDVWTAYQESPGPDGVTYFQLFLGNFTQWLNIPFTNTYAEGTPILQVLTDIATALGVGLHAVGNTLSGLAVDGGPLTFPPGFVKDAVLYLNQTFPSLVIRMDSQQLIVSVLGENTGISHTIEYFSSPPRKEAYGWSFVAPWNPAIRPQDIVLINPKYYAQSFVTFQNTSALQGLTPFNVLTLEFEFSTIGNTNNMSLVVLDGSESKSA